MNALPFWSEDCSKYKYSSSDIFKKNLESVVIVSSTFGQGSGFVVKQDKNSTLILTNAHVVGSDKFVQIKWSNNETDSGEIVGNLGGYELKNDLALIKINQKKGKPLKLLEEILK